MDFTKTRLEPSIPLRCPPHVLWALPYAGALLSPRKLLAVPASAVSCTPQVLSRKSLYSNKDTNVPCQWIRLIYRFTLQLLKYETHFTVWKLISNSVSTSLAKLLQPRAAAQVILPWVAPTFAASNQIYFLSRSTCTASCWQSLVLTLANHQ